MSDDSPSIEATEAAISEDKDIFAARFQLFMAGFENTCETERVPIAIAIVMDPTRSGHPPLVYMRGNTLDAARVMAGILRNLKSMICEELTT